MVNFDISLSQRSLDEAELAERNPGSSPEPRIPAFGLHPSYHRDARVKSHIAHPA